MTPARDIIKRLGGFEAVASVTGVSRNGVQRWAYPGKKSPDGNIPTQHWACLLAHAKDEGLDVTLADFVGDDLVRAATETSDRAA